jgi:hypothetical protein
MQWIPRQIVAISEDFHSQVGDEKVRTTLYKVRWEGYDGQEGRHLGDHHTSTGICYHGNHKELAGQLAVIQQLERGVQLGAAAEPAWRCLTHTELLLSLQKKRLAAT